MSSFLLESRYPVPFGFESEWKPVPMLTLRLLEKQFTFTAQWQGASQMVAIFLLWSGWLGRCPHCRFTKYFQGYPGDSVWQVRVPGVLVVFISLAKKTQVWGKVKSDISDSAV